MNVKDITKNVGENALNNVKKTMDSTKNNILNIAEKVSDKARTTITEEQIKNILDTLDVIMRVPK